MLKVYGFSRVDAAARGHTRDLRVLWALEEVALPHEWIGLDHPAGDLGTPAYRRLSPFQQIPAIDDDGVVLSESAAILVYLARKTGRLIPGDLAGEAQVVRWCFAAMNSLEMPLMAILLVDAVEQEKAGTHRANMVAWARRLLAGLERWLDGREFVATDRFTVADILTAHVLTAAGDELLAPCPGVVAYRERCLARPAWQRTLARYFDRVQAA